MKIFKKKHEIVSIYSLGVWIRKYRRKFNMKQKEFADSIGVKRQTISDLEIGMKYPSVNTLKKISILYNIEIVIK